MNRNVNEAAVSRVWTWEELAAAIKKCGGKADNKTLESLAGKLKARLEGACLLDLLMEDVEITPEDAMENSLFALGVSLPSCGLCDHMEDCRCCYYCDPKPRMSWGDGLDCLHFSTSEPKRTLWYEDADFDIPVISLTGKFPGAAEVIAAIRENPKMAKKIDDTSSMVDEVEDAWKWRLE